LEKPISEPRKFDKTKVIQRSKNESMKLLVFMIFALTIVITPAFADQVIYSEGIEYEIGEITEVRKYKLSPITKTQGYTTTGEMFFLFTSSDFEKVMFLTRDGQWQKAEMRDKVVEEVKPTNTVITKETTDLHYLLDQYERVYNKAQYKLFIKTYDKSIYSGNDFQNFEGKISGAKISAIIIDPNGEIKADFEGYSENGMFEGVVDVPENLWMGGWYTVDIVIEFDNKFNLEQLSFYVYGKVAPSGDLSCTPPLVKVNGVCV